MPRCTCIVYPAATIFDILQFHVEKLSPLTLSSGHAVVDVYNIVRVDNVIVFTSDGSTNTKACYLCCTSYVGTKVCCYLRLRS